MWRKRSPDPQSSGYARCTVSGVRVASSPHHLMQAAKEALCADACGCIEWASMAHVVEQAIVLTGAALIGARRRCASVQCVRGFKATRGGDELAQYLASVAHL